MTPVFDPKSCLAELDAHGIYSIARMVVFKDPIVAEARPDLAVRNEVTGDIWRDMNGTRGSTPSIRSYGRRTPTSAPSWLSLGSMKSSTTTSDFLGRRFDERLILVDDYSEANRRAAITGAVALGGEEVQRPEPFCRRSFSNRRLDGRRSRHRPDGARSDAVG